MSNPIGSGMRGVVRWRSQRFDSALRLNVHFHVLWLDGVYGWAPGRGQPVFHEHAGLCDGDVELLVQRLRVRVRRALRKLGKWVDAENAADGGDEVGDELLPGLVAAAIEGRAALGECAGQRDGRVGQSYAGQQAPRRKGPLCAESGGFSLHAGAWVAARDRERLAKLCRYAGRPAVAESRLVELGGGRIGYALKKRWRDGTTAVVMTQEVLMECLCALVPRPRKHLVTYHGVLAPASGLRSRVVPLREGDAGDVGGCRHGDDGGAVASAECDEAVVAAGVDLRRRLAERQRRQRQRIPHGGGRRSGVRRRLPWAALLQRVFGVSALVCPKCAGLRRVLAAIHDPAAIARVLGSLGVSGAEPGPVGCRAPPGREGGGPGGESGWPE
ncbi:MAG: transposase [Planctomycetes bacterium]|nr:transposase [Planctomycetota bacterium]